MRLVLLFALAGCARTAPPAALSAPPCGTAAPVADYFHDRGTGDAISHPLALAAAHGIAAEPRYDRARDVVRFTYGNADLGNSPLAYWSLNLVEVSATTGEEVRSGLLVRPGAEPVGTGDSRDFWEIGEAMRADWTASCGEPLVKVADLGALALGRLHGEPFDVRMTVDGASTLTVGGTAGGKQLSVSLIGPEGLLGAAFVIDEPDCAGGTWTPLALYRVPSTGRYLFSALAYGKAGCFMDAEIWKVLRPA